MCRFIHRISLLVNDAATLFAIVSIGQKQRRLYFLKNESNTVDRGRRSQRRRTRRNSRRDFGDEDLVGVGRRQRVVGASLSVDVVEDEVADEDDGHGQRQPIHHTLATSNEKQNRNKIRATPIDDVDVDAHWFLFFSFSFSGFFFCVCNELRASRCNPIKRRAAFQRRTRHQANPSRIKVDRVLFSVATMMGGGRGAVRPNAGPSSRRLKG